MMRRFFFLATAAFWLSFAYFGLRPHQGAEQPVAAPLRQETQYALAQLAQHASELDCWMAIDGVVYDITAYLPEHPSRPSIILAWCGREASEAYRTKLKGRPHSPAADSQLNQLRIGTLQP